MSQLLDFLTGFIGVGIVLFFHALITTSHYFGLLFFPTSLGVSLIQSIILLLVYLGILIWAMQTKRTGLVAGLILGVLVDLLFPVVRGGFEIFFFYI